MLLKIVTWQIGLKMSPKQVRTLGIFEAQDIKVQMETFVFEVFKFFKVPSTKYFEETVFASYLPFPLNLV